MPLAVSVTSNHLLGALPAHVLARCATSFRPMSLKQGEEVETIGRPVSRIIFPQSGVLSVFATTGRDSVEVGMIGREGMTGLSTVFGSPNSTHTIMVQMDGTGLEVEPSKFRLLLSECPPLEATVKRYGLAHMAQISQAGLANARRTVTERLARWLLMCLDRVDETEICVTHEALSGALGVRRPGVTVATHLLEGDGAIRAKRGRIFVLDREKLERLANGSYGAAEDQYRALMAASSAQPRLALSNVG